MTSVTYFELTKHVWLASYLLAEAALVLVAALAAAVAIRLVPGLHPGHPEG